MRLTHVSALLLLGAQQWGRDAAVFDVDGVAPEHLIDALAGVYTPSAAERAATAAGRAAAAGAGMERAVRRRCCGGGGMGSRGRDRAGAVMCGTFSNKWNDLRAARRAQGARGRKRKQPVVA